MRQKMLMDHQSDKCVLKRATKTPNLGLAWKQTYDMQTSFRSVQTWCTTAPCYTELKFPLKVQNFPPEKGF
jgi:hypothetical protein